jgi:hypothetical protein
MGEMLDRVLSVVFRVPEEIIAEHDWTGKLYLAATVVMLVSVVGMFLFFTGALLFSTVSHHFGISFGPIGFGDMHLSEMLVLPAVVLMGSVFPMAQYFVARGIARFRGWARRVSLVFLWPALISGVLMLPQSLGTSRLLVVAGEVALSAQFLWYFHRNKALFNRPASYSV